MAVNYVKFNRGSAIAFQNLATKNSDTLYFITDSDSNKSQLYLGDKLIAGGITELNELSDIQISEALEENQILVFDSEKSKWINKGLIEAIGVMTGATAEEQGSAGLVPAPGFGYQNKFLRGDGNWVDIEASSSYLADDKTIETNGVLFSLKDFEKKYYSYIPASGSEDEGNYVAAHYEVCIVDETHPWKENLEPKVVKENGNFILGWFEPNPTLLDGVVDQLSFLQTQVNDIIENIEELLNADATLNTQLGNKVDKTSVYTKKETEDKINEFISNSQHLIRKIFDSKEEAEAFISEINNPTDYVYLIKNNSVTADKYAEYLYIDGALEPVGSWDVNLDGYVTEEKFETALSNKVDTSVVSELEKTIFSNTGKIDSLTIRTNTTEQSIATLTDSVSDLTELLNSSYIAKEDFDNEITLVKDDLTEVKESVTWGTLN